jgi:hypothetical protein
MQCPLCEHSADDSAFGNPAKCPSCGVYYEKLMARRRKAEAAKMNAVPDGDGRSDPPLSEKLMRGIISAKLAVEAGREGRKGEEARLAAQRDQGRAQPVVVVDLKMSFSSMVWFMVKWVIASIPAMIILILIFVAVTSFIGGLAGGLSRYL